MRQYLDFKKQFKILISVILLLLPLAIVFAQVSDETQNKIDQNNVDINKLEQEIQAYLSQLNEISKQKNSLDSSIKELDLTKKKLVADINVTEKKIYKINLKIQGLSTDINIKKKSISNNAKAVAYSIKKSRELEDNSFIENLLSSDDLSTTWNDIENIISVREKIRNTTKELKQVKNELEDTRIETIDAKKELVELRSKLADQKKIIDQNTKEKKELLTYTKNNEANYQKLLADRLIRKNALEQELRDYESKIVYVLDPSKLPAAHIFSWPLDYVYITQLFGKTVSSKRLYASGTHSGVDFRASMGTPVKAMGSGVVVGIGDTDKQCPRASFGKYVFIQYDNGLSSAFGHLSLIKTTVGSKVNKGTIVAYSGNTGYSTGPHLHVTIYAPGAAEVKSIPSKSCPGRELTQPIASINGYLDPMYFFPFYNKP